METQHYDYRDLENQTYSTVGQQLNALNERAQEFGDEEKIKSVKKFRAGIQAAGLGDSTKFLKETHANGGTVMGQYNNSSDQISLADLDTFEQAAYQEGMDLEEYSKRVAQHELRHREQNQQGNPETHTAIASLVGKDREEVTHALIEADACEFTPKAYPQEQAQARQIASKLQMSEAKLHKIHRTGNLKALIKHINTQDSYAQ